jgi:hypothetical protein
VDADIATVCLRLSDVKPLRIWNPSVATGDEFCPCRLVIKRAKPEHSAMGFDLVGQGGVFECVSESGDECPVSREPTIRGIDEPRHRLAFGERAVPKDLEVDDIVGDEDPRFSDGGFEYFGVVVRSQQRPCCDRLAVDSSLSEDVGDGGGEHLIEEEGVGRCWPPGTHGCRRSS